jgi:hypothetical protein
MSRWGRPTSVAELIETSLGNVGPFIETVAGHEEEPAMIGYADFGVPWHRAVCRDDHGLQDITAYRQLVNVQGCAAWMDNTTLVTATALLAEGGTEAMTPLTVWDLVTFARAVICFERIYHHKHPDVNDSQINAALGANILTPVPLPIRETGSNRYLPEKWDGAHRWMCDIWGDAFAWLRELNSAAGTSTIDGEQLAAVTEAWRLALGRDDLRPEELVDHKEVDYRWTSPSNALLAQTANATSVNETRLYLDPDESFRQLFEWRREHGRHDASREELSYLLSDLNLRSYINQRIAEFFELPYVCSAARVPFLRHLYNRAVRVQRDLTTVNVLEDRYAELAETAQLRLPVFLAVAILGCSRPEDLLPRLAELRNQATKFRTRRAELDAALARHDLKEAARVSSALRMTADDVLAVAGRAYTAVGVAVVDTIVQGDTPSIGTGITAAVAAGQEVLRSSFVERLLWRLRRPHLLWMNSIIDEANHLTEALPDFSRIWQIPENRQQVFAARFQRMARLQEATSQ